MSDFYNFYEMEDAEFDKFGNPIQKTKENTNRCTLNGYGELIERVDRTYITEDGRQLLMEG